MKIMQGIRMIILKTDGFVGIDIAYLTARENVVVPGGVATRIMDLWSICLRQKAH
jgi:hypothetical protein